ncbi:Cytochrome c551 peroxidase precursor [compost metagenome]
MISYFVLLGFSYKDEITPQFLKELRLQYEKDPSLWPKPEIDADVTFKELGAIEFPYKVKDSAEAAKIALGKTLFFDPRLSGSRQISCASCHEPELNWTDGRRRSIGNDHLSGIRNSPSIQNLANTSSFMWDGRHQTLEDQIADALTNPIEMAANLKETTARINSIKGYQSLFVKAYHKNKLSDFELRQSIAAFVKSIKSRPTRFDNFVLGRKRALSDQQILGLHLFRTKARCVNCHNGPLFTDEKFHNLGFSNYGRKGEDLGRYNTTKLKDDVAKFKTPSLRDVMRTFPWFHDGRFNEIEALLNMYVAGMPQPKRTKNQQDDPLFPQASPHLKKLEITLEERAAIISFLQAITSSPLEFDRPSLPK